jgi:hypothetical protein
MATTAVVQGFNARKSQSGLTPAATDLLMEAGGFHFARVVFCSKSAIFEEMESLPGYSGDSIKSAL